MVTLSDDCEQSSSKSKLDWASDHRDTFLLKKKKNVLNKSENAKLLLFVEMAEKRFKFQYLFCKIKCLKCRYQLNCTRVPR